MELRPTKALLEMFSRPDWYSEVSLRQECRLIYLSNEPCLLSGRDRDELDILREQDEP